MAMNRRDFLKITAGTGLVLASDIVPVQATMPKELPPDAVGMFYDATLCIGCKVCMVNCKTHNSVPGGALYLKDRDVPYEDNYERGIWDAPMDLSSRTVNIIKTVKTGTGQNKDSTENGYSFVKQHCLHCISPACVSACPVAALQKDPRTGVVHYIEEKCIGCRYCLLACPFKIPKFEYEYASPQVRKCQLCHHRYAEGKYAACCEFCPTGASIFGKVADLKKEARKRLSLQTGEEYDFPVQTVNSEFRLRRPVSKYINHVYGETEAGGTQYLMLAGVPFEWIGYEKAIDDRYLPDLTWAYISKIPAVFVGVIAAGTLAWAITSRKNKGKEDQNEPERD
jgi:Fe-S-cluster-containing dehydrogenase component